MPVKPELKRPPTHSLQAGGADLAGRNAASPLAPVAPATEFGNYSYAASPLQLRKNDTSEVATSSGSAHTGFKTGLPDHLKSGIESQSGLSLDNVKVHYNSPHPAQVNALAYTQGTQIHLSPGQERHLPHEAWHVVQQAQGRVRPTTEVGGMAVNNDVGLEHEADRMGSAISSASSPPDQFALPTPLSPIADQGSQPIQRVIDFSDKVQYQYTKDTYLTMLWREAQKTNNAITFDEVRQAWIEAEADTRKIVLPDRIDLAWKVLRPFVGNATVPLRAALDPAAEALALDAAGASIPMTERTGLTRHRNAVRGEAGTIFPAARAELDQDGRNWDPDNPAEFEAKPAGVDYTSWDNLAGLQKRFLLNNQKNINRLVAELYDVVAAKNDSGDYILALFSQAYFLSKDSKQIAEAAGIVDGGNYLLTLFNIRRGLHDKDVKSYRATPTVKSAAELKAKRGPIDWLNEGLHDILREDAPFLRQRAKQVENLAGKPDDFDILKKWASGGSSVQEQHSNMDADVLTTIANSHGKMGKQSPVQNFNLLDKLLADITPVVGTLYGAYPRNDSLRPGYLFSQGTPMSASESPGGTVTFSAHVKGAADRYKIYATGVNGIPISAVVPGVGQGQREVLFRSQATFKILSIEEGKFGANVSRIITMVEQRVATSRETDPDAAVKTSQQTLLNEGDKWLTRFSHVDIDEKTQAWFISNNAGGRIEGQQDASFAFPYGRAAAHAWHNVITNDTIPIWDVKGFIRIAANLLEKNPSAIRLIVAREDPGSWGEPKLLEDPEKKILRANGLVVTDDKKTGLSTVSYKIENKEPELKRILTQGSAEMEKIKLMPLPDKDNARLIASAKLAARIQQRLSVLHPLHDGNGRISRAYAYLILRRLGYGETEMPAFDQDKDQSTPTAEWEDQFAVRAINPGATGPTAVPAKIASISSEDDVVNFIASYAGTPIIKYLADDLKWLEDVGAKKTISEVDMWIVKEMQELILQRPDWLSPDLIRDMEAFTKLKGDKQQYAAALALKKRLAFEIIRKIHQTPEPSAETGRKTGGASIKKSTVTSGSSTGSSPPKVDKKVSDYAFNSARGNLEFAERLDIQTQSARDALAIGGQEPLINNVLNHFDERNHGIQPHLIAYFYLEQRSRQADPTLSHIDAAALMERYRVAAEIVLDRLNNTIIPRARLFFTWEEEVDHAQWRWVDAQGVNAGVMWQQEMTLRTRLAREWIARNPTYRLLLDAAQLTLVDDALGAAERARQHAINMAAIDRTFINGQQLVDGNCLFAALAEPDQVSLIRANQIRAAVVAGLQGADVLTTPLAELRQMQGDSAEARAARVAYQTMRNNGVTLLDYRAYMGISGVWGGDPEILSWSRLHPGITVYLLEPGNAYFRRIQNGAVLAAVAIDVVQPAVTAGTGIAIRNTGNHYIRLLLRAALGGGQPPVVDKKKRKGPGSDKKRQKSVVTLKRLSPKSGDAKTDAKKRSKPDNKPEVKQGSKRRTSGSDANPVNKRARPDPAIRYDCTEFGCGKSYSTKSNLARHTRDKH